MERIHKIQRNSQGAKIIKENLFYLRNLTGRRFGRLTALKGTGKRTAGSIIWMCLCACGNFTMVQANNLKNGNTRSCGCLRQDVAKKIRYKHGDSCRDLISRLYKIWDSMKTRCYSPISKDYKNYGKRGIKVCDEWKNNYRTFKFWAILNGYQDNLTIDRIDNDGNYEPSNCQWLTRSDNLKKRHLERRLKLSLGLL